MAICKEIDIARMVGMEYDRVWKVISELMETLQVINPRLYAGVIKKL